MEKGILIIDYGSQYTQLIARRIREQKVYCEIYAFNKIAKKLIDKLNPCGIILSGGPNSVLDKKSPKLPLVIQKLNIPILGICYGLQLLSILNKGEIKKSISREYGLAKITIYRESKIIPKEWFKKNIDVWMSHGDHVFKVPKGFNVLAKSNNKIISIIENKRKNIYGLQFHPEVHHTYMGYKIIKNFIFKICKAKNNWIIESFIERKVRELKNLIGNNNVVCGLSGGVDSSVVAYLLHKAIGKNLYCIFVDHGLLRKNAALTCLLLFPTLE